MKDLQKKESIIILILTAIFPLVIVKNSLAFSVVYILLILFLFVLNKIRMACFVMFILCFCIPGQLSDQVNTSLFRNPTYLMTIAPIIFSVLCIKSIYRDSNIRKYLISFITIFVLSFVWFIFRGSILELDIFRKSALMLSIMILFYKSNISQKDFFILLDSISSIVGAYYIIEFFIRWSPYGHFFSYDLSVVQNMDISVVFRPHGLLGNPLVTGFLFLFELCTLVYRYFITQKLNIFLFSYFSFICLLTISKSYILGVILIVVMMFFLNSRISKRNNFKYLILLLIGGLVIFSISDVALGYFQHRMDKVSDSSSFLFRFSNFSMIWNLFCDYPFGVGVCNLPVLIETKYAHKDWISGFTTLDNVFLNYIGEYGVFAFIPTIFLFRWIGFVRKLKESYYVHYIGMLSIAFILFYASFMFNWDSYYMQMALLGAFLGTSFKSLGTNQQISK